MALASQVVQKPDFNSLVEEIIEDGVMIEKNKSDKQFVLLIGLTNAEKIIKNTCRATQQKVPQYQFDEKSNQIVGKPFESLLKALSNGENEPNCHQLLKESGLMCDYYGKETGEKLFKISKNQKPGYATLRETFPNATIIRDRNFEQLEKDVLEDNVLHRKFTNNYSLVPFQMPNEFNYTCAIMVNNLFEGLLHTFVRHSGKLYELIPELKKSKESLSPIKSQLEKIQNSDCRKSCGIALNELSKRLLELMNNDPFTFIDVKMALLEAQLKLHKYMKETVHLDDSRLNKENQSREYFKVSENCVLNVCVSEQLYPEADKFGSRDIKERPIRVIKTAFFSPMSELETLDDDDYEDEEQYESKCDEDENDSDDSGIEADCYEIDGCLPEYNLEQVEEFKTNSANHTMAEKPPGKSNKVTILSSEQMQDLKNDVKKFRENINKNKSKNLFLHVRMPTNFSYTATIMTNSPMQGLLHSFIRHWDQWLEHIPSLATTLKCLEPIQSHLDEIRDAPNNRSAEDCIEELNDTLVMMHKLSKEKLFDVQRALFDVQMKIREFIQNIITTENYLQEGANYFAQVHAYFKVPEKDQLMVVGVSKQLFPVVEEFGDDTRPVRFITTIYFISSDQYPGKMLIKNNSLVNSPNLSLEYKQILDDYKSAIMFDSTLQEEYPKVKLISKKDLNQLKRDFSESPSQDTLYKYRFKFNIKNWLLLKMPEKFSYTCVIVTNNIEVGLLHTLARHSDQWRNYIEDFDYLMNILSPISEELLAVYRFTMDDEDAKETAYKDYYNVFKKLHLPILKNVKRALFQLQMKIYFFMEENITSGKYLGERVNISYDFNIQIHVLFEVVKLVKSKEKVEAMNVGVSWQLFERVQDYDNRRPIRSIITAYFREFDNDGLVKIWDPKIKKN